MNSKAQLLEKLAAGRAFVPLADVATFLGIPVADLERSARTRGGPPFGMPMMFGRQMVDLDSFRAWLDTLTTDADGRATSPPLLQKRAADRNHVEAEPASTDRILRLREVCARTGVGRSSIYAWVSKGIFPKPVILGARAVGWRESVIRDWLASL